MKKNKQTSFIFYSKRGRERKLMISLILFCGSYEAFRLIFNMTTLTTITDDEKKRYVIISYMFECGK